MIGYELIMVFFIYLLQVNTKIWYIPWQIVYITINMGKAKILIQLYKFLGIL